MDVSKRFSQKVILQMQQDIIEADGNEVFWGGKIDDDGIIVQIKAGARGNIDSVVVNEAAAREGNVLIHNHPGGNLHPSEADQNIAYNAQNMDYGFYIVNNDVSDVYVVVEPVLPKKSRNLTRKRQPFTFLIRGPLQKSILSMKKDLLK